MTPSESSAWFFAAAVALVVAYETYAFRVWGWRGFLSNVLYEAAGVWTWLPWVVAAALAVLWWHVFFRFWPFGGD